MPGMRRPGGSGTQNDFLRDYLARREMDAANRAGNFTDYRRLADGEWVPAGRTFSGAQGPRMAGPVGSRSMRGPTTPWGSTSPMRTGGGMSPALARMFGGGIGGSDEELMALLQQLGLGG